MISKFALLSVAVLLLGAVLGAQPPADFEASVKAAMAPAIAQQRAAVRRQVSATSTGKSVTTAQSSFIAPFSPAEEGAMDCDPLPHGQLETLVKETARRNGVDTQLVRAVIDQESAGRPCALSAKGAEGLMQLMPATADEYDVDDPFDPQQNVEAGTKLLKSLLERYNNDPSLALSAYNAGSGRVDREGGVPPIPETEDYVAKIIEKLRSAVTSAKNSGWEPTPPSLKDF
jgi:Transglycosylase SLT domain